MAQLSAKTEIIRQILIDFDKILDDYSTPKNVNEMSNDELMEVYEEQIEDNGVEYPLEYFRAKGEESNIEPEYSRHYETMSVCRKLDNGVWVGWTYYYGGGKYAEPEAVEWLDDAYLLDLVEEKEVTIVKRIFKKKEA